MSLYAMPILVVNMGGEMLYILEQRLKAQKIQLEKSKRVLRDVISAMFGKTFLAELFKAQAVYTNSSTRQIFDRLAHSSIMRLNTSSMDKLYELMLMGFKYQVMTCNTAKEVLYMTKVHLNALQEICSESLAYDLLDETETLTNHIHKKMSAGEFSRLRRALFNFFQDRRVKVSLFLEGNLQKKDGLIICGHKGKMAAGFKVPGSVEYFDDDGKVVRRDTFSVHNSKGVLPPSDDPQKDCVIGQNMYSKRRPKGGKKKDSPAKPDSAPPKLRGEPEASAKDRESAKAELNLLANLIGGGSEGKKNTKDNFTLENLFPEAGGGGRGSLSSKGGGAAIVVFDSTDEKVFNRQSSIASQLGATLDDIQPEKEGDGGDDDLLALMDDLSDSD